MANAEDQLSAVLAELSDVVQDIEDEQIRRFLRNQALTRLERYVRDSLLGLLAADFPQLVTDFRELNQSFDDRAAQELSNPGRLLVATGGRSSTDSW